MIRVWKDPLSFLSIINIQKCAKCSSSIRISIGNWAPSAHRYYSWLNYTTNLQAIRKISSFAINSKTKYSRPNSCSSFSSNSNVKYRKHKLKDDADKPVEVKVTHVSELAENLEEVNIDSNFVKVHQRVSKNRKELISHLNTIFGIGTTRATLAVTAVDRIEFPITTDFLYERFTYLKNNQKLSSERIKRMPSLIIMQQAHLNKLVKSVSHILKLDFGSAVPFTQYNVSKLMQIQSRWNMDRAVEPEFADGSLSNRMEYLARRLKCSHDEIIDMLCTVPTLSYCSFSRIRNVINLLYEYGVQPEDIIGDPWIFLHNIEVMKSRIKIASQVPISRIKPWVLRADEERFHQYLSRFQKELNLRLGHADLASFLQDALRCTEADVKHIMFKVPVLKHASARKLYNMIQFLFSRGYTTSDIIKIPRILARSRVTVEKRFLELTSFGFEHITFTVLCLNAKEYETHLNRVKSTKPHLEHD